MTVGLGKNLTTWVSENSALLLIGAFKRTFGFLIPWLIFIVVSIFAWTCVAVTLTVFAIMGISDDDFIWLSVYMAIVAALLFLAVGEVLRKPYLTMNSFRSP